ncbi:MAG: hypothetical protein KUG79_08590 [Pseudomonadales bacterium]|nr:hypothetical protein [Pseudomonadales bacterium]
MKITDNDGRWIPCGMVLMAKNYNYLNQLNESAIFLWYLSTAPEEFFTAAGLNTDQMPKSIGRLIVDSAIVTSHKAGKHGKIGLHADPADPSLDSYYEKAVGLDRLAATKALPKGRQFRQKGNDGRYFYCDEQKAERLLKKFDKFR